MSISAENTGVPMASNEATGLRRSSAPGRYRGIIRSSTTLNLGPAFAEPVPAVTLYEARLPAAAARLPDRGIEALQVPHLQYAAGLPWPVR